MSAAPQPGVKALADAVVATELSRRALERLGVPARLIAAGGLAATVDLVRTRAVSVEAAAEGVARTLHAAEWQPAAYAARPVPPMVVFIAPPEPPTPAADPLDGPINWVDRMTRRDVVPVSELAIARRR